MKKFVLLFILCTLPLSAEYPWVTGFINDNYTGDPQNGIDGRYFGADDFLTLTLLSRMKADDYSFGLNYQVVTSRKFAYRFDLLNVFGSKTLNFSSFNLSPYGGIYIKNNLQGSTIQNGIHRFKEIPEVHLKYSEPALAPSAGVIIDKTWKELLLDRDSLRVSGDLEIPLGIKPVSFQGGVDYSYHLSQLILSLNGGYKFYFNSVEEYTHLVRNGFTGGIRLTASLFHNMTIDAGCFFFPVQNTENDPLYFTRNRTYTPQIYVLMGFMGDHFSLREIIRF